jgi:hypothetical protein
VTHAAESYGTLSKSKPAEKYPKSRIYIAVLGYGGQKFGDPRLLLRPQVVPLQTSLMSSPFGTAKKSINFFPNPGAIYFLEMITDNFTDTFDLP